jgi:hypothetical protein
LSTVVFPVCPFFLFGNEFVKIRWYNYNSLNSQVTKCDVLQIFNSLICVTSLSVSLHNLLDFYIYNIYIYNIEIQWDIYIIFLYLCGFVLSAERQERMLNGKDNGVLGFI